MKARSFFLMSGWAVLSVLLLSLTVSCIFPDGGGRRGGGGWHNHEHYGERG
jgi:hypothetical protein